MEIIRVAKLTYIVLLRGYCIAKSFQGRDFCKSSGHWFPTWAPRTPGVQSMILQGSMEGVDSYKSYMYSIRESVVK